MHAPRRKPETADPAVARGSGAMAQGSRWGALAVACTAGLLVLTGCAKMDAALGQQWMVVDLNPGTSVATALQIRAACSHIQNTPAMALPAKRTEVAMLFGVRYDTTNSSPANLAELQTCLQRFPAVQGVEPQDSGDAGG